MISKPDRPAEKARWKGKSVKRGREKKWNNNESNMPGSGRPMSEMRRWEASDEIQERFAKTVKGHSRSSIGRRNQIERIWQCRGRRWRNLSRDWSRDTWWRRRQGESGGKKVREWKLAEGHVRGKTNRGNARIWREKEQLQEEGEEKIKQEDWRLEVEATGIRRR